MNNVACFRIHAKIESQNIVFYKKMSSLLDGTALILNDLDIFLIYPIKCSHYIDVSYQMMHYLSNYQISD